MPPIVTYAAADVLTARAGQRAGAPSIAGTLRLFTSATTPNHLSVPGDFTEVAVAGYARQAVTDDSFSPTTPNPPHSIAPDTGNPFTFGPYGAGVTIRGWFYVMTNAGEVIAERFTTPIVLAAGARCQIALSLTGAPEV